MSRDNFPFRAPSPLRLDVDPRIIPYESGVTTVPDLRTPEQMAATEAQAIQRRAAARARVDAARSEAAATTPRRDFGHTGDQTSPSHMARDLAAMAGLAEEFDSLPPEIRTAARLLGPALGPLGVVAAADPTYSPGTLAGEFIPFSDEIAGTVESFTRDRPLSESLREASERRAALREQNPGSALAGTAAQGIVLGPFIGGPQGAAGATRTLGQAVRQGALAAGQEGAILGGMMGADNATNADDSNVSVLGAAGDFLRAPSWGTAGNVGSEALRLTRDASTGAAVMGAMGAGLGGAFGGAGYGMRRLAGAIPEEVVAATETPEGRAAIEAQESVPDDLANADWRSLDEGSRARMDTELFDPNVAPSAGSLRPPMTISPEENIGRLDSPFTADPDLAHLRAAGLTDRRQLRAAENVYGAQGLADRLHGYNILRRGEVVPQSEVARRARELQSQSGGALQDIYREFGANQIDMRSAVDELEALAQQYERSISPEEQAVAPQIRQQIRLIMDRPGNIRTPRRIAEQTIGDPLMAQRMGGGEQVFPTVRVRTPQPAFEEGLVRDQFDTMQAPSRTMRQGPRAPEFEGELPPIDESIPGAETYTGTLPEEPTGPVPYEGTLAAPRDPTLYGPNEFDVQPLSSIQELNNAIRARDQANRDLLSGSSTHAPTIARRAGVEMRRILNRARDRAVEQRFGTDRLAEYRRLRDLYATTAHVAPPGGLSAAQMNAPTLSRRVLGGAGATTGAAIGTQLAGAPGGAVGGVAGGIAGYAAGNALKEYEWSILAALNNRTGTTAEAVADIAQQLFRRVRGRPGYEAARSLTGPELIESIRSTAARVGDADVEQIAEAATGASGLLQAIEARLQTSPQAFGQYAQPLLDAMRRGELARAVQEQAADPAAMEAISAAASDSGMDDSLAAQAEAMGIQIGDEAAEPDPNAIPTDDDALAAQAEAMGISLDDEPTPDAADPNVIPDITKTEDDPNVLPNIRKLQQLRNRRATP